MGKFLDRFKNGVNKIEQKVENQKPKSNYNEGAFYDEELDVDNLLGDKNSDDKDLDRDLLNNGFTDVGIPPAQKPESFHHFILENQYKDLERSIRGFKEVYNKDTQEWETKRKSEHCFTDEEAEEILRTAQSHLATDIKLGFINKEIFGLMMQTIYDQLEFLFESIAEYRYGRYGNSEKQYQMKLQNMKIFLELFTRIQANYSRSIQGTENKYTHDSVRGQESLQNTSRLNDPFGDRFGRWS